ncbi:probable mitochondrial import inner membrane translocase subunit TIM21 [Morus notabilis]|uniref:probable mitochondrial import inner membrane translocase subunit TIM21 n=1 Tax=Morus notabilis TaxID=981085 RepID=UPI000CED6924|nr:probable mitochondrial import inner membrane translocase subunit TIM21 [Morus notabilis]
MGSRKSAMELWRKKETDFLRILPRRRWWECRAFHSPKSNPDQFVAVLRPGSTKHSSVNTNNVAKKLEISLLHRRQYCRECIIRSWSPSQVMKNYGTNPMNPCIIRSISSQASKEPGKSPNENKKDISKVEDPFDAPTYNIPETPVTFTEGASYSLIILAGLGIAAAAGYAVFKELIFEPKEYTVFNKALKRIQDDAEVRVRIGYPITGYGQESRNRAARQRIPNRTWTDEDGVEHVEVNFYIRGPHGAGKVFSEMYKDQADKQWKFTYLIVEIKSPSPAQLILESYLPAYAPA